MTRVIFLSLLCLQSAQSNLGRTEALLMSFSRHSTVACPSGRSLQAKCFCFAISTNLEISSIKFIIQLVCKTTYLLARTTLLNRHADDWRAASWMSNFIVHTRQCFNRHRPPLSFLVEAPGQPRCCGCLGSREQESLQTRAH